MLSSQTSTHKGSSCLGYDAVSVAIVPDISEQLAAPNLRV